MTPFPRADFPALVQGETVYLDAAATTQKPQEVIDVVMRADAEGAAPVHRALYARAEALTEAYERVRADCAAWFGWKPYEVVMTTGATMGLNLVMQSWALHNLKPGDEIVIPEFEHHSNYAPWVYAAEHTGARLKIIPVRGDTCSLDPTTIVRMITNRTRLVSFACHTNTFGPVPVDTLRILASAAKAVGAAICIDATQAMLHRGPATVTCMDPDFVLFSSHKMCGPSGVGVALIAERRHAELRPWMLGGGMLFDVTPDVLLTQSMPRLLEAGTPPISSWIGFGVALEYLQRHGPAEVIIAHEAALVAALLDGIQDLPGVRVLGDTTLMRQEGHMVAFALEGIHAHDLVSCCALDSIAVRAGTHCAQPLHRALGLAATVRVSCAPYTTLDDVQRFLCSVHRSYELLAR